jgi:hypothetical protein
MARRPGPLTLAQLTARAKPRLRSKSSIAALQPAMQIPISRYA